MCFCFVSWKCTLKPGKAMLWLVVKQGRTLKSKHAFWIAWWTGWMCMMKTASRESGGCTPWNPFTWLFLPSGSEDMEACNETRGDVGWHSLGLGFGEFQRQHQQEACLTVRERRVQSWPWWTRLRTFGREKLPTSQLTSRLSNQPQQLKGCLECEPPSKRQM